MPRGDGTGPQGFGPLTGRGLGPCGAGLRRGFGRGIGRGFGRGIGYGRGAGYGAGYGYRAPGLVATDEKTLLEADLKDVDLELKELEAEKAEIEKRLKELKAQK